MRVVLVHDFGERSLGFGEYEASLLHFSMAIVGFFLFLLRLIVIQSFFIGGLLSKNKDVFF